MPKTAKQKTPAGSRKKQSNTLYNAASLTRELERLQKLDQERFSKRITELRREYTTLRDIAQKRIKRGLASEFGSTDYFQQYKNGFKKLSNVDRTNYKQLAILMASVSNFVNLSVSGDNKGKVAISTLKGQQQIKNKIIFDFHESGFTFINTKNYGTVMTFLKAYSENHTGKLYDSIQALEWYEGNEKRLNRMTNENVYKAFSEYEKNKNG